MITGPHDLVPVRDLQGRDIKLCCTPTSSSFNRISIKAFSEIDFTEDLKKIDIPVLVMHGDDDQIVPIVAAGPLSRKLLRKSTPEGLFRPSPRHARHQCVPDQRRFTFVFQRRLDSCCVLTTPYRLR
jgi:pimeloyl-ACP methyl ester carboxylesterase